MPHTLTQKTSTSLLSAAGLALALAASGSAVAAEDIPVWTYDTSPPYVIDQDKETGLSYDFAKLLTERSDGKYLFEVEVLPRPRVDLNLTNNEEGLVLWVNNAWFEDPDKSKYLWTDTLIEGSASIVSPASKPVEYDGAESLIGMDLVGVRGHRYGPVDELVAQDKISRKDVNSEESLMHFISSERAEVSVIAYSSASYYVKALGIEDKVHFSSTPHSVFNRYALVSPALEPVHSYMETLIKDLENDSEWLELLKKYGLK